MICIKRDNYKFHFKKLWKPKALDSGNMYLKSQRLCPKLVFYFKVLCYFECLKPWKKNLFPTEIVFYGFKLKTVF